MVVYTQKVQISVLQNKYTEIDYPIPCICTSQYGLQRAVYNHIFTPKYGYSHPLNRNCKDYVTVTVWIPRTQSHWASGMLIHFKDFALALQVLFLVLLSWWTVISYVSREISKWNTLFTLCCLQTLACRLVLVRQSKFLKSKNAKDQLEVISCGVCIVVQITRLQTRFYGQCDCEPDLNQLLKVQNVGIIRTIPVNSRKALQTRKGFICKYHTLYT